MQKNFSSGDGNLFSPIAAGLRRWPGGQLSPRASSIGPIQSVITQWGWGFNTLRGASDPGDLSFPPRLVHVMKIPKNI